MEQDFILKEIQGQTVSKIFKQFDMIIINFGNPIICSLHINSAVRVCQEDKILLNNSDEFFTKSGKQKTEMQYKLLEEEGFINDPNSLFANNIKIVNKLLKGKQVFEIKRTKWHDLILFFEEGIEVQIIQDCLQKDYEYYRYIKFCPFYNNNEKKFNSYHYVVKNVQGTPTLMEDK